MTIVWGHNHFRLKSVQPHEVGLFDRSYDNISFDLQQKYGHLFYIPIFPMGKAWTINKGDGKKYVCPAEIAEQLNQNPGTASRKSIFAWSGILAVLIIWGSISLKTLTDRRIREKQSAEIFQREAVSMSEEIAELIPGKYLLFNPGKGEAGNFEIDLVPFRVLAARESEVLLGSYIQPEDYASTDISYQSDFIKFLQHEKIIDSFWISRASLKNAVNDDADDEKFKGAVFEKYPAYHFKLREIRETDPGPLPERSVSGDMTSKTDYELINSGYDAHADSIVSYSEKYTGRLSGNRDFSNGAVIPVHLSAEGMYKLWFSDKEHKYVFVLDNTGDGLEIRNMEDIPASSTGEVLPDAKGSD